MNPTSNYVQGPSGYYTAGALGKIPISYYSGFSTRISLYDAPLRLFLGSVFGSEYVSRKCAEMRSINKASRKEEYEEVKKTITCATPSCVCDGIRGSSHVVRRNPIICLDFDAQDNPILLDESKRLEVMRRLYSMKCVYAAGTSCSGKGLFCLIPLVSNKDDAEYKEYALSLFDAFERLGLHADPACKDVTRLRVASAEKPLVKPDDANVAAWSVRKRTPVRPAPVKRPISQYSAVNDRSLSLELLDMLCGSPTCTFDDYNSWMFLGFILAPLGEDGYWIFDRLSQNSANYKGADDTRKKWEQTAPDSDKDLDATFHWTLGMAKRHLPKGSIRQARINILKRSHQQGSVFPKRDL